MRYYILALTTLFISLSAIGQVRRVDKENELIGKISFLGVEYMRCAALDGGGYKFTFENASPDSASQDLPFSNLSRRGSFILNSEEDLRDLYEISSDVLEEKPIDPVVVDITNDILYIIYERNIGGGTISYAVQNQYYPYAMKKSPSLSKKNLTKLFGISTE